MLIVNFCLNMVVKLRIYIYIYIKFESKLIKNNGRIFHMLLTINVSEKRSGNEEGTIQRGNEEWTIQLYRQQCIHDRERKQTKKNISKCKANI